MERCGLDYWVGWDLPRSLIRLCAYIYALRVDWIYHLCIKICTMRAKSSFSHLEVNCIPFNFIYISQLNRHDLHGVIENQWDYWSHVSFTVPTFLIQSNLGGEPEDFCCKCNKFLPLSELRKHIGSCKGKSHRKRDHQDHPVTRQNMEDWSMDDDVQMLVNTCTTALLQLFSLNYNALLVCPRKCDEVVP